MHREAEAPAPDLSVGIPRRSLLRRGVALAAGGVVAPLIAGPSARAAGTPVKRKTTTGSRDPNLPDYLGYRRADYAQPYAKYFTERVHPVQAHIPAALAAGPTDPADVPSLADLRTEMNSRGASKVENGYAVLADGTQWSATRTLMPGVRPEMWDWWFGWHLIESARYKLWHPEAHLYAAAAKPLADEPGLTDKQRYIANTSYVDEYLPDYRGGVHYYGDKAGGILVPPGITFRDPTAEGFDLDSFDGTIIVGRGGQQGSATTNSIFCHQVRATKSGSEMRSRFYIGADVRDDARKADPAVVKSQGARGPLPQPRSALPPSGQLLHTAMEMNHLASFLPALHAEFRTDRRRRRG